MSDHDASPQVHTVGAPDGRSLRVFDYGSDDDVVVVSHHGTPACGDAYPPMVRQALERGLRLIAYDRPGYAASDRQAGRSIASCTADVLLIADTLGIGRFGSIGISGGGSHSLACAAMIGDRAVACVSACTLAPFGAEGLDWAAGMGELNSEEIEIAAQGYDALYAHLQPVGEQLTAATAEDMREAMTSLLSEVDREMLTDELLTYVHTNMQQALAAGAEGWADESLAMYEPWGFDLTGIVVPVQIWHGGQDRFVPVSHGRWLAEHIPSAEAMIFEEEGHVSLQERHTGAMLEWLAEQVAMAPG
jgi:pimeloyl-ACP methyl ester carboxylesterase